MGKQAKLFLLTHFDSINEQDFQQGKIQLEEHVQNTISHQHPDNNWMEKCWRDLCKMKELLKERDEGQTEPRSELFLSKIHHVVGLINGGQSIIVYQMNRDIVWYVETCPKFPFGQETNSMLRFEALDSSVFSATFLRPTTSAGGSNTSFYRNVKQFQAMWKPARDNAVIRIDYSAHSLFSGTTRNLDGPKVQV